MSQSLLSTPRMAELLGLSPAGFHRLAYVEWGNPTAPVTICVHGLTRNGRDFDRLAAALAASGRRVVCPDIVGRGLSDRLGDPAHYGYPQYLADMTALIARLDTGPIDWIGTSMGGLIGLLLAAQPQNSDPPPGAERCRSVRAEGGVGADRRLYRRDAQLPGRGRGRGLSAPGPRTLRTARRRRLEASRPPRGPAALRRPPGIALRPGDRAGVHARPARRHRPLAGMGSYLLPGLGAARDLVGSLPRRNGRGDGSPRSSHPEFARSPASATRRR